MTIRLRYVLPSLALVLGLASAALPGLPASAHNEYLPSVPLSIHNFEHVANIPDLLGNNIDFFERRAEDGTVRRFIVAATLGNGFDIVEITDPTEPSTVGRYLLPDSDPAQVQGSSLGSNYHAWVSVNPRRNIVALTVENGPINAANLTGRTVRHSGGTGMQFVDISDVTNPRSLGRVDNLEGPHTVRMVGDNHAYTSLDTFAVDYTDPMNPVAEAPGFQAHEFWEDANIPGRMYVGMAGAVGRFALFNSADEANVLETGSWGDTEIVAAHEVYPSPDSSYIGVADFTGGQTDVTCPGGGVHFYDLHGRHAGGSQFSPAKMGAWFAPYSGATGDPTIDAPNSGSCTMHSWQHHPERSLALAGIYTGGTWVFDPSIPTPASGGDYVEYDGVRGRTTWGQTLGNVQDALDYVNATAWLPFDLTDPAHERIVVVSGLERGVDIYRYTGPMPKKLSRITADVSGGQVTGRLERYAVLTDTGWTNLPLAGKTLTISAGSSTITVTTDADGNFRAAVPSSSATVSWSGDEAFGPVSTTAF